MAYTNEIIKKRLDSLNQYASELSKSAVWSGSGEPVAMPKMDEEDSQTSYIYEFYVALRILSDLIRSYHIELTNYWEPIFPKAPGKKEKFPYFLLYQNGELKFQFCLGTGIVTQDKELAYPDISIQIAEATVEPNHEDVVMVFDAKYKENAEGRLSRADYAKVFDFVDSLDCDYIPQLELNFHEFSGDNSLNGNFVITNGQGYKEDNQQMHERKGLKELVRFDVNRDYKVCH